MTQTIFCLLFLILVIVRRSSEYQRSLVMSLMTDAEFQCIHGRCQPFSISRSSLIRHCQMSCLAQDQCRTVNFRRAINQCEMFVETADNGGTIIASVGVSLMVVIDGTRVPAGSYQDLTFHSQILLSHSDLLMNAFHSLIDGIPLKVEFSVSLFIAKESNRIPTLKNENSN